MKIEFQNVTFTYPGGVTALRDISLAFEPGRVYAILGANGAGKTTLTRHMNGSLQPSAGSVLVGDWETRRRSVAQLAKRVGYVFQNPDEQLFARTVWDEVAFGPRNLGHVGEQLNQRVAAALDQVGLAEFARKHPYDLRPSQRKLVALAAVLSMQTPVLVLDEPTTGLDMGQRDRVGQILDTAQAEGRTVIVISHDVDFCAEHCDQLVVMADAEVLIQGSISHVLGHASILAQADVELPALVRLASALGWDQRPLTAAGFVDALSHHPLSGATDHADRPG